ncbi:MAG: glycosyltransferase [Quinella sp. 2Q5]|nr:glycosyltransferase [Quinella sp. 2Q5]
MVKRKAKTVDRLKISACYMVRDAADDLRRSLESLAGHVDEIIVVDTGSVDGTVAVAEEFGARIFHEPWQDDFSTPRNVALREATGNWIVFLDADEFFVNDTAKNLRRAIKLARAKNFAGLFVHLVNVDADNGNKIIEASPLLRIFAKADVRYVGKIHETIYRGDEPLTNVAMIPAEMLTLWHTGYSSTIVRAKFERNLKLLLDELTTSDKPERTYAYLADCYYGLGDLVNAEKFARLHVETIGHSLSTRPLKILLDVLSKDSARREDYIARLKEAVADYPHVPEFAASLAEIFAERGDFRAAVNEMRRALAEVTSGAERFEPSTFTEEEQIRARKLIDEWSEKIPLTPDERRRKISELTAELIQVRELFHDKERLLRTAEKIFALKPEDPEPLERIATLYIDYRMADAADEVVTWLEKNFPPSALRLMLRARVWHLRGNQIECIRFAERSLAHGGGDLVSTMITRNVLGQTYRLTGNVAKAIEYYRANALQDISSLVGTAQYAQAENIRREEYGNFLFNLHNLPVTREELFDAARGFGKLLAHIPRFKHNRARHARHKKIRIGYISPDVRFHVVAFFSAHFFTSYDKTRFEVFIYANNAADHITRQFAANVDGFRDILDKTARTVADQILADEIDILVDLAGHTGNNSLDVLAYKPAPIQISGIGYMSTTGLDTVDYFIADKFTDPEGLNEKFFTEKILRLQHSHFCYVWHDASHHVTPAPCVANGFVTFGSFNNFCKVTDKMLTLWAKILDAVPNSRLYLKAAVFRENFGGNRARERMRAAGIDLDRVTCEPDEIDYVRCYERVDIALDTFPYPGGGTTCDALYMGAPVITLVGERHNSRFGYSLLMNMGLEDFCAFSADEYVAKAVALANDRQRLRELHLTLRRRMEESPVMNDAIYMGEIEQAYEKIFRAYVDKKPLPIFPQEPPPLTIAEAREFYRRASLYLSLEVKPGKSRFNRVDFKRTLYFAELAASVDAVRDTKLLVTIADRRFNLDDNIGAYENIRAAIDHLYASGEVENFSADILAEFHAKLAKYAQNNGHHVEAVQNYERAFELAQKPSRRRELFDSVLLSLHFLDLSSEELTAPHFDYGKIFGDVEKFTPRRHHHERIRIGYISGDFRKHAAFAVVFGFVSCHDRAKFEVTCYSRNPEDDEFTEFYRRGVEHFVDVQSLTDEELAEKIFADEIDVAIDLAGHTGYNGLGALAHRPAPVQISGIGYMSTTGLSDVDYFITDDVLDPPGEHEKFFAEKLLYMPAQFSYARREDLPAATGAPCLSNGYVTFGTICRYMKINDDMLAIWAEILRRVPNAKLLMRAQEFISNRTVDVLFDKMKSIGCDMERVTIRPAVHDYFGAISAVDIILDAYPYVGGATTLDALYMGVPVINFFGERHSTRFGKSILNSIGLGELSVNSVEAYIQTAVALANDTETLDALHKNLRAMFLQSAALDPMKYCRAFEAKLADILAQSV